MSRFLGQAALTGLVLMAFTGSAHAYLDPGTGSLVIQGLIAAFGAIIVAGKMYWANIKGIFVKSGESDATAETETRPEPSTTSE